LPSGRDLNAEQRNKILRLALAGCTVEQIAERMGISKSAVNKHYPRPGKPQPHKNDENGPELV
jgi:DNA-binding NarL/FixJ family response regulator